MRRLVIRGPRRAEFEVVEPPGCPREGVVIRARTTAISTGTEIRVYRAIPVDEAGRFLHETVPFELPAENGYSMVGEVVEVGRGCDSLAVGDRVFAPCPHRELAAISAGLAVPLPEGIPDEHAVFLSILEVAHRAIRQGEPAAGADVAIVGQGVIGLSLLAYCVSFGLRVAVIDPDEGRLAIAREIGAMHAISPDDAAGREELQRFFDGQGADVVFEATSNWQGIRTAMEVARTAGTVVIVSRNTTIPDFNPVGHPFLGKKLRLVTSYNYPPDGHRWDRRNSLRLTLDLLQRGRLDLEPMITHRVAADELPEMYRRLDEGDSSIVGTVLSWGG